MRSPAIGFGILFSVLMTITGAPALADYARPTPGIPDKDGITWDKPVYDPGSKSYFEYKWTHRPEDIYLGANYSDADAIARSMVFEGVPGRLAVVDSIEVHEFLLKTFHPKEPVLIGLRYWCKSHQLETADGKILTKDSFQAWDENWDQDNVMTSCINNPLAPGSDYAEVGYYPPNFRWVAKGHQKHFMGIFVQFPTGHP